MFLSERWQRAPYWLKGGIVGGLLASIGTVFLLLISVKGLVIDGYSGAAATGGSVGNTIAWLILNGFLALLISIIGFVILLASLFSIGAGIGWLYGKRKN